MSTWAKSIPAVTLFVEDLPEAVSFYQRVFQLPVHFADPVSTVFKFGDTLINLLDVSQAPELIGPAAVASPGSGARVQFSIGVDDVDAVCEELLAKGVVLINGPLDRPWGIRTACFQDPAGHIWEIGH